MTDDEGNFEVELPLGDYVAIIAADGFVTATEGVTASFVKELIRRAVLRVFKA